ncbi:MAG: sodium:proton exchanger [Methanobacterium sp. BRmetb2]|nr:MAG: sodium:proton exchanger [Methanobacterium sp. BRmetb2]
MIEFVYFLIIVFIFSLISQRIESIPISPQMIFIGAGMLLGSGFLGVVNLNSDPGIVLFIAEITLVLVLFSDASKININDLRKNNLTLRLLSIGLSLTIISGIVVATLLLTDLSIWEAAIIGAVLAPTDAALGQVVVENRKLPLLVRETLEVESGLNDGLAVPFLLLFVAWSIAEETFSPVGFFIETTIAQIGFGALIGIIIGLVGGWFVYKAQKHKWMTETFQRISLIALAIISWLIADQIGGSGFIAAFVAGLATGYMLKDKVSSFIRFTEAEGQLLNLFVFFLLGFIIFPLLPNLTWQIVLYAILSLTIIRMLPVGISLIGSTLKKETILFMGWFGPRGLASIVLVLIALEEQPLFPGEETLLLAVFTTVLLSVFLHGMTASPLANIYAKILAKMDNTCMEKE